MNSEDQAKTKCFGLFNKKERWGFSLKGFLVFTCVGGVLICLFIAWIHPFLAVTRRVDSKILVVEGWIHEFAIREAKREFTEGNYDKIITTGGPVVGNRSYTSDFQTSASVARTRLLQAGVPMEKISMAPSREMGRDRTYSSAVALREWMKSNETYAASINILTESTHARRSLLLFEKALGKEVSVGVIAVPIPDYQPSQWWKYSEGVKETISEAAAYFYAKFFFFPASEHRHK